MNCVGLPMVVMGISSTYLIATVHEGWLYKIKTGEVPRLGHLHYKLVVVCAQMQGLMFSALYRKTLQII